VSVNGLCLDVIMDESLIPMLPSEGGVTAVSVSNVDVDKSLVYVRLAGEGMVKLNACLSSLDTIFDYENILPSQQVNHLYPGKLCLVALTNGLFRARIEKLDHKNHDSAIVYLVDVGTSKDVKISSLLKLEDEMTLTIPFQAVCCKLSAEVYDVNHRSLRDIAANLNTLPVLMRVESLNEESEEPDLIAMWLNDPACDLQIVAHDCDTDHIATTPSHANDRVSVVNDTECSNKNLPSSDCFKSGRNQSPESFETFSSSSSISDLKQSNSPLSLGSGDVTSVPMIDCNNFAKVKPYNFEDLHHISNIMYAKTKLDDYKEVLNLEKNPFLIKVEDVISPDYLQLIAWEKLQGRNLLTAALSKFYDVKQSEYQADKIFIGESYVLCASNENCWYRVRVLSMMDDKISVYMYDYGECRVTSKTCLKTLDPQFRKINELIITAKLAGIQPFKQDNYLWPTHLSDKLSNTIKGKCYFAHVLKIVQSDALLKRDVWEVCLCDTATQDLWINDILVDEWKCANYVE